MWDRKYKKGDLEDVNHHKGRQDIKKMLNYTVFLVRLPEELQTSHTSPESRMQLPNSELSWSYFCHHYHLVHQTHYCIRLLYFKQTTLRVSKSLYPFTSKSGYK
jgi:hypothetical protein